MKNIINEDELEIDKDSGESNSGFYFLSALKNGKYGLEINGISNGKSVTFYIFKHTNNKFYFVSPECIVKPSDLEKNAKEFDDITNEDTKLTLYKLIKSHSYFIKIDRLQSSSKYEDEPTINKKSKLKLDLFITDNNKKMYVDIPTYFEKIKGYKELTVNTIKALPNELDIIKSCLVSTDSDDSDYKNIDAFVIHRESDPKDRAKILNNEKIEQFFYETDDNDRFIIQKNGNRLLCILNDDDIRPCVFDNDGFIKVLIQ